MRDARRTVGLVVACVLAIGRAHSSVAEPQQPAAVDAFEVASVKPSQETHENGRIVVTPGMFRGSNVSARAMMRLAFGEGGRSLLKEQLVGGPGWTDAERFDIIGRTEGHVRTLRDAAPMIRNLLETRFGLRAHRERRSLSVYALRRAASGTSLGPHLRPSSIDCADPIVRSGAPREPSTSTNWCGSHFEDGSIRAGGYSIESLVFSLSAMLEKIVRDDTGLKGTFDMELEWNQDPAALSDRPSLFTAIQEQLGLHLVTTEAEVDVVVIDDATRPSPD